MDGKSTYGIAHYGTLLTCTTSTFLPGTTVLRTTTGYLREGTWPLIGLEATGKVGRDVVGYINDEHTRHK